MSTEHANTPQTRTANRKRTGTRSRKRSQASLSRRSRNAYGKRTGVYDASGTPARTAYIAARWGNNPVTTVTHQRGCGALYSQPCNCGTPPAPPP